ncbi:MAG: MFS transporter [Clostridiales bacterium]|nr:MAG: MFS transporter [Clostridiales bacterium]
MRIGYKHTMYACYTGFIVQATINNFIPLLFVTFQTSYGIPLSQITFLVTFNFGIQLVTDLIAAAFVDKIGYRISCILAHVFGALGLISLAILPDLLADPFTGLLISVFIYGVGGGLLEVLMNPVAGACPVDNKASAISLLNSFYSWGSVGIVLLSTIFFSAFGLENWKVLALIWAIIPIFNIFLFAKVPIGSMIKEGEQKMSLKSLLSYKVFWIMLVLMLSAGACEQAIIQWASTFVEQGLGISKTIGDLAGPMSFAFMMGISRLLYSRIGHRLDIKKALMFSGLLCLVCVLILALSPWPILGLIACAVCGFSVGILWPGAISLSVASIRLGGTTMFAFLALAGAVGCTLGPTVVGTVSSAAGDNLTAGFLAAAIFPLLMIFGIIAYHIHAKKHPSDSRA